MNWYLTNRWRLPQCAAAFFSLTLFAGCETTTGIGGVDGLRSESVESVAQIIRDNRGTHAAVASDASLDDAWRMVDARECDQATAFARNVLRTSPQDVEALLIAAECAAIGGSVAVAERRYEQILNAAREPRALRGLGVLRAKEGHYAEARTLLEEAAASRPEDWRTWNALGFIFDVERDWIGAVKSYEHAAELAPDRAAPLNNLGLSYLQQGNTDAAISAFTEAVNREPEFEAARENFRVALIFDDQMERALWNLPDEERPVVLNNAGVIARSQGNLEVAANLFQRALDESPVFYERAYRNLRALREAERR